MEQQQLHTCWSNSMWSHQVTSLMTVRPEPTFEESQQPCRNQLGIAAARKANDEKREEKFRKILLTLEDGPQTALEVSQKIDICHGHTQHVLTAMHKRKLVAFDKGASRTRYWRLP
jgi:ribosomal protein L44E